jgi:tetratricopeptide (TPR) repeat protein
MTTTKTYFQKSITLFHLLETRIQELQQEIQRKLQFIEEAYDHTNNNNNISEDDDDEEDEEIELVTHPLTLQAMEREAEGDYDQASQLYFTAIQEYLHSSTTTTTHSNNNNINNAKIDIVALAAFIRFHVQKRLDELKVNEDLATAVYDSFELLRQVNEETFNDLRGEFAVFLYQVDHDEETALNEFQTALQSRPDDASLHYNAANFFSNRSSSESSSSSSSNEDLITAENLYRKSLELDPDLVLALNNFGAFLVEKQRNNQLTKTQKTSILNEAAQLLQKAEFIAPGAPGYNLACIYALLNDHESCKKYLQQSLPNLELRRQDVENDPDLSSVKNQEWFKTLMKQLKQ